MTKKEILEKLDAIVDEGRYKDGYEREAICEAAEIVEACDDEFIAKNIN